jgi:hypothetical protein
MKKRVMHWKILEYAQKVRQKCVAIVRTALHYNMRELWKLKECTESGT